MLKAVRLNPTLIEVYAPLRNTPERSKMWIQLEKLGRRTDSLTAIGKYGVDSSVVAHMKGKILAATTQTLASQTKRLGTINIAASTPARNAVQDIVQELLATNFASVGAPAVRLILDTGGAAPGRKPELRRALDAYTKAVPRHRISQSDLRELNNRGLLSRHKRSPLAKMFGW